MRLYIGNATKQHQIFSYRVPERLQLCTQNIMAGSQVCIAPNGSNTDLTTPEIDAILAQYSIYGIRDANDLDQNKDDRPFSGLVYSIGKPVTPERLRKAIARFEGQLDKLGKRIRTEAAVAAHSHIEGAIMGGEEMKAPMDVSIEEVEPSRGLDENLTHVSEGVRITRKPTSEMPVVDLRSSRR